MDEAESDEGESKATSLHEEPNPGPVLSICTTGGRVTEDPVFCGRADNPVGTMATGTFEFSDCCENE